MLEKFAEGIVVVIQIRNTLPSQGRLTLAGNRDVHHRRRVLLDQRAEIRDGHFHLDRRGSISRQRRRQYAGRQYRPSGGQRHRHHEFFELARNLHGRHLFRNVNFIGIGTDPIPHCTLVWTTLLKENLRRKRFYVLLQNALPAIKHCYVYPCIAVFGYEPTRWHR